MKINMYAIKDTLVGFKAPFCCKTDQLAIRIFKDILTASVDNDIKRNPGDHQLFHLGEFDEDTGECVSCVTHLINGIDLVGGANG